ncbi:AI-2E family transporter [Desulfovibrio inopinatus]|uniref:AI-2E family transporter n=1 Tax=Desulfovibrio inopinatus TaxID=102109 RepID=UPI000428DAC2|nr:AI-2E family transporter [Desulfovibrio inopinatus]
MVCDIKQFFDTNRTLFIWAIFFGLLWLIISKGLFGLVFITFILGYVFNGLIEWLCARSTIPRRAWTILIYLVFITLVLLLISMVAPVLVSEGKMFFSQLPKAIENIDHFLEAQANHQPMLAPLIVALQKIISLETIPGVDSEQLVRFAVVSINQITVHISYFLMGTLFSFLILLDYPRLRAQAMNLRQTRLRHFYRHTAGSIIQCALFVGEAFKAQTMISCANTMLTALGMWGLGIHPISLLSTIVFIAGLIPVLGMFISTIPIMLIAFNIGGLNLALLSLVMVIFVHLFETYVLNPRIFSAVFKISPVLTLFILYIAHTFFGLWGMILGVPITVFVFKHLIQRQASAYPREEKKTIT